MSDKGPSQKKLMRALLSIGWFNFGVIVSSLISYVTNQPSTLSFLTFSYLVLLGLTILSWIVDRVITRDGDDS